MAVFLYAPGIKAYVSTQNNGIIDISDDLTQGTMVRRSDGVSTFSFSLQNPFRKYSGVFTPNDRIIVMMKRVSWVRTFTGYLNQVPLVTAWPSTVQLTASCSLKRLQYWFWDPGLPQSQNMVAQAMSSAANPDDGGTAAAVIAVLGNVVGWPAANIHIAGMPQAWSTWAYQIAQAIKADTAAADALAQAFYASLGAGGIVGGVVGGGTTVPSGTLKAGTYAGQTLTAAQVQMATLIYNTITQMGGSANDAAVAIMTAYQESRLGANAGSSPSAIGVFQQNPAMGWGTAAQAANPTTATQAFGKVLLGLSNRSTMTNAQQAQAVQRSAFADGSPYAQWQSLATTIVSQLTAAGSSSLSNVPSTASNAATKTGKAAGSQVLGVALNLVATHSIPYQEGGDSPFTSSSPTLLDCSSFVQWVYYHATGSAACPRTSQQQSAWATPISLQQALNTPGALLFIGPPGAATHVEISAGTGADQVGAMTTGTVAGVTNVTGFGYTAGGLMPGVDYSGTPGTAATFKSVPANGAAMAAGAPGAASAGASVLPQSQLADGALQVTPSSTQPWYNPADPFDALFGSSPWLPTFDADAANVAEILTGPRALMADSPLLPYIKNLFGSCMRSYCSAPNGDLIAWFPDFYGIWGTAAVMQIESIELQDFTVYWSDENLVTHQFVVAAPAQQIDLGSGVASGITISAPSGTQSIPEDLLFALTTMGIASIDVPAIMSALFGLDANSATAKSFTQYIYNRFGARPDLEQLPGLVGPQGEFFAALFLFMRSWAYQYDADVPMTFMPELWPGMLIQVPDFAFQAYVTTVTHTFQMGQGGFFNTTVNIAAPSRIPGSGNNSGGQLIGLPIAGGLVSGTNLPNPVTNLANPNPNTATAGTA
jgi:cell wall-associated NlpC family hydrolase